MGLSVVGLHDVGGRNRHVAGDAGGRDEERAGGVLDGVVGRGVGAVGRQDAGLPREGAGVAGVGVGQRALGGVCQLEGLALGQAHGLDAADLLLGARVGKRRGLALEGDVAQGHLEGAVDGADGVVARVGQRVELVADDGVGRGAHQGLRALDEDVLEALVADEALGAQRVVGAGERGAVVGLGGADRGDLDGPGGDSQELLGVDVALVDARDAGAHLDRQGVGHVGGGDVGGVGRPRAVGRLVLDQDVVAVGVGGGGGAGRVGLSVVGLDDVGGRNRHVAGDAGRPLGGKDVLGALVEIVDDNLLASFKDAAVRGEPTGERMSRRAMRHGSLKAQVSGTGQHHTLVVDERVDTRLAAAVARHEGDGRGSFSDTPCGGQDNGTVIACKLARHVKRSTGLDERAVLHDPSEEVGLALGSHKVSGTGDLNLGAVCIGLEVERQLGTSVVVAHIELAVVEPLARDVGVTGNAGLRAEQPAVIGIPAVERVVRTPRRACGQEVRSRTRSGIECSRALVLELRVLRSTQVPAQRDLLHGPLGIDRDIGMRHSGIGEVERDRAGLVDIPTHKRALDAVGVRVIGDVVGIRRKGRSVLDADDIVVVAGHIVIGKVVGLELVSDIDGRCVDLLALGHIALVRPERSRGRVAALNPTSSVLVQVVTGVLLVHRQRATARCHRVDKRKRAVGLLVVVADCAAALLALTIEVARRNNALGVLHVVRVVRVSRCGEVIAGQKDATRSRGCITTPPRLGIGRIPIVVIRPFAALERSSVQTREALDELGTLPLVHLEILHRAQHAIVIDVHDSGTVASDGDTGLGVVGVEGKAGVVLVVGTGHDGTGRRRLLGRLNELICLGGVGGVLVVGHALPPIVDGVGNLDGRPVSSESHGGVERVAFANLRVAQVPTLERIPGTRAHGQHDSLTCVHEHMVDGGAASGVEGNPYTRHDDSKHVDMVRALRHCHRSQPVAGRVGPAHNAVLGVDIVLDARNVVGLMVLNDHRAHDLHAVGVVEVDMQDGGRLRVHVVRCGRAHTHGLREVYGVLAQIPTGERLARNLGSPGFDKHLAVLDDLLADNGVVGVMEPVGC